MAYTVLVRGLAVFGQYSWTNEGLIVCLSFDVEAYEASKGGSRIPIAEYH